MTNKVKSGIINNAGGAFLVEKIESDPLNLLVKTIVGKHDDRIVVVYHFGFCPTRRKPCFLGKGGELVRFKQTIFLYSSLFSCNIVRRCFM